MHKHDSMWKKVFFIRIVKIIVKSNEIWYIDKANKCDNEVYLFCRVQAGQRMWVRHILVYIAEEQERYTVKRKKWRILLT